LKAKPTGQCGKRSWFGILLCCFLAFGSWGGIGVCQSLPTGVISGAGGDPPALLSVNSLIQWEGLPVRRISFEGVSVDRLAPLPGHLDQAEGAPLNRDALKRSLRRLYSTGLFETMAVEGVREQDGVALIFRGTPRTFIGTVSVQGAKGANVNTQLERASQLAPGARFTPAKIDQAVEQMRLTLAQDGFHASVITHTQTAHPEVQLVDLAFHVLNGPQARLGTVEVTGEPGMSVNDFRRHAHLRAGEHVDRETGNRALAGVLKAYRKDQRLEPEIKLVNQQYVPASQKVDFRFSANRGPVVKVLVEGASANQELIRRVIPIFEEGSVDEDLLMEGNRRLRDDYQRMGYFDAKVEHELQTTTAGLVTILFKVRLGPRRRVERVSVAGNRYFDSATLKELLSVHPADSLDRHGDYSQALVSADINALQALYKNNGFSKVKITPETSAAGTKARTTAPLTVVYRIEEGEQLRVGTVRLEGNDHADTARLSLLMNTVAGQLLSPRNLGEDRDALLIDYLSRGFDQVRVEVAQQVEPADASKVDVVFHITEGRQIFVRNVLLTGLHYTRPATVAKAITLHPGDPLNETALMETQRNLYDFALFNEIDTAIENPSGGEAYKTVLLQATEARRWALTYGGGIEAQTGTPQHNCGGILASGANCSPNGKTGVSYRVLADITRNNLFGREQSVSLRGNYGLLEQKINLLFQNPHFEGNRNFGLTISGGYANSLDVSTYVASKLETGVRWTEHFNPGSPATGLSRGGVNSQGWRISRANTLVYEFDFRRVKVDAYSLQVYPTEIALLSTAVRVAGPSLTWIRDTRDSALDSQRGTYTSVQEFLSADKFGAQANFNRLDLSNSSYYRFDKGRIVLARNTRYGQERAFGKLQAELIPLPERLYAGGATSLRSSGANQAGPRDPETGYPIGGAGALINSTELRLPPPTLPWLGNTVSLVLFHDMGNVFTNAGDAWASALRVRQPERDNCKIVISASKKIDNPVPTGPSTSTGVQGQCSFNYFSHAPGLGLRYHTPVGPIRLDFSYNLNPPIYPINIDYSLNPAKPIYSNPHVGVGGRFNFFFSLGQTF